MNQPAPRTPALDFLRQVQVWQRDSTGTAAGLAVAMADGEERTLQTLLASFEKDAGNPGYLEQKARMWLVGYREMNPPLTAEQRARLDDVIDRQAWYAEPVREPRPPRASPSPRRAVIALTIAILAFILAGVGIAHLTATRHDDTPPPAGVSQPQKQLPAQLTDLQRFRADWDAPAAATADAGGSQVQVVLLQDQLYYPVPWSVSAGDPGWQPDTSGSLTAQIQGGQAVVTDSNGVIWTVATGQPFALASNLQFVFRVQRDGTVQSMPQAHAIAVRHRLSTK